MGVIFAPENFPCWLNYELKVKHNSQFSKSLLKKKILPFMYETQEESYSCYIAEVLNSKS